MEKITLVTLEEWNKMTNMSEKDGYKGKGYGERLGSRAGSRHKDMPYVILGAPDSRLLALQQAGYCVLAELTHLQGLSEEAVAEVLCKEEAIREFTNVCIYAHELPQGYLRRIWCRHVEEPVLIAETERLIIRESIAEDAEAFYALYQDEACRKYLEWPPVEECGNRVQNIKEYERYIVDYQKGQYGFYEYGMWSVVEKASGKCVGRAGVELQAGDLCLGYAMLPQFRHRGYATEACKAILAYCWECEYGEQVHVKIDEDNEASKKVAVKLGLAKISLRHPQ